MRILLLLGSLLAVPKAFSWHQPIFRPRPFAATLKAQGDDGLWKRLSGSPEPYKFGDLSKLIDKKVKTSINKVTGKDEYQFGDLSYWLDKNAKDSVKKLTGKDDYEFGDLSRWVDARVKDKVNEFTGQEIYVFGDLTREIAAQVVSRKWTLDDLVVLLKALLSFGVGLSPVASFLPIRLLVELLNYSIIGDLGNRLTAALALAIDAKVKEALTGDADYQLGDATKRAVANFTGESEYSFGDITRTVISNMEAADGGESATPPLLFGSLQSAGSADLYSSSGKRAIPELKLGTTVEAKIVNDEIDEAILAELDAWDAALDARTKALAESAVLSAGVNTEV